jgi:hypothetical protein
MPRIVQSTGDRPFPILDTGEQTRLDYWREHSEALPRELLELTGWITREPERTIPSEVDGHIERIRAADATNAVFRVPEAGPARELWHVYLTYLRREQANRRLLDLRLARAAEEELELQATLASSRNELERAHRDLDRARTRVAEAEERARLYMSALMERARAGNKPVRKDVGAAAKLVHRAKETHDVDVAAELVRRTESEVRVLEQRGQRLAGRVRWIRERSRVKVYIGLWGEINAFLDLQLLSVASVGTEELRRHPRPHLNTPTEIELALEQADGA